jgi:hypothetical protein
MPKSIPITTPWPTSEEVGKRFRVPKRRQKELRAIAEEYVEKLKTELDAEGRAVAQEEKRKDVSAAD